MRFFLHLLLLLPASVGVAWLFVRSSGQWWLGLLGGVLGVGLVGALLASLHVTGWLNLGESPLEAAFKYAEVFGWNVGVVGGLVGTILGLLGRVRKSHEIQPRNKT